MPKPLAATSNADEIVILGEFPGVFRAGKLANVVVTVWFGQLTHAAVQTMATVTGDIIKQANDQRWSSVHMITHHVKLPDAEVRRELSYIARDSADSIGCCAVIVDGRGFWASAVRGFITGVRALAPRSFDIRAEASIEDLLTWLPAEHKRRTGLAVSAEQIGRLLQQGKNWQIEAALLR